MPIPIVLALAGALAGAAFGAWGGAKLGSWLKDQLSEEEQEAVVTACEKVGLKKSASTSEVEKLPDRDKAVLVAELEKVRSKAKKKT